MGGLALVGEAPGAVEVTDGAGFRGPSGATLRHLFARLGAPRLEDVAWVTNSCLCRPPGNRTPTNEEVECCRPRLIAELHAAVPRLVLPLGNTALQALTGDRHPKITKQRGKLVRCEGFECLPSFHPSNVRRNPSNYRFLKADVIEAVRLARGGNRRVPPLARFKVVPEALLDRAVDAIIKHPGVHAADIETTGLDLQTDRILELGVEFTEGFCLVLPGDLLRGSRGVEALQRLFDPSNGLRWLWHNGKFDTAFLKREGISNARVDEDTLLLHYSLDENQGGHGLKPLSIELLGAPDYDLSKKEKENMAGVDPQRRRGYMAKDIIYCKGIFKELRPKVAADPDLERLYTETLIPVTNMLTHVEACGVCIDTDHLEELDTKLTSEKSRLTAEIQGFVQNPEFNPKSSKQVIEAVYGVPWHLSPLKGFGPTSRALVLERLEDLLKSRGKGDSKCAKFLAAMRLVRKTNKMKGTYVDGLKKRIRSDGRVYSSFKQHGTRTGRLSSGKAEEGGRGEFNLHSIPRDPQYRSLIRAPEGFLLLELDWSQAELRLLADKSRDPLLVQIYVDGKDLHDDVVKSVIAPLFPALPYKEQRYQAKIVNFGTVYGRQEFSMSREYNLPLETCRALIKGWHRRFHVASAYLESQAQRALSGRPLITRFGRKRRFGAITREVAHHIANEAKNNDIQSEASDLTARCAVLLREQLPETVRIVNSIHDALLLEIPYDLELARETARRATQTMEDFARDYFQSPVPFVADAKIGTHWGHLREFPRLPRTAVLPLEELARLCSEGGLPKATKAVEGEPQ